MVSDKMLPCLKSNPNPAFLAVPADVTEIVPITWEVTKEAAAVKNT